MKIFLQDMFEVDFRGSQLAELKLVPGQARARGEALITEAPITDNSTLDSIKQWA